WRRSWRSSRQVRSEVRERLARMRLAPEVAIEHLPREPAPAEPEGERQGEDQPAEGDPEGHEDHLLADPEMRHRRGDREEQDPPADGARDEARFTDARIDAGDEGALADEVCYQPAD